MSKKLSKKNVHFWFLSFSVGERKRENMKNMEKLQKNVFWVGVKKTGFSSGKNVMF